MGEPELWGRPCSGLRGLAEAGGVGGESEAGEEAYGESADVGGEIGVAVGEAEEEVVGEEDEDGA